MEAFCKKLRCLGRDLRNRAVNTQLILPAVQTAMKRSSDENRSEYEFRTRNKLDVPTLYIIYILV